MVYAFGQLISIVDVADDFYEAYKRCTEGKNERIDERGRHTAEVVNIPAIVNGAFALELYLKSFIPACQIEPKELGHNIANIFSKLKQDLQERIRSDVEPNLKGWTQTFDEAINGIGDGFEYWRYIHEKEDLGYGLNMMLNVLPLFLEAVRAMIKSNQKTD